MATPPFDPASEPLGSTSPLVREVNSKLLDLGMHSKEDKFTDRFGEEKMTWEAMQNERIGLLIAGGQIFPSVEEGRAAAENGWYFYAVSPNPNVTRSLYRRVSASESEHIKDDPSAEFVESVAAVSDAAIDLASQPGRLSGEFYTSDTPSPSFAIADDSGAVIAEWDEDGFLKSQPRGEFYTEDDQPVTVWTDDAGVPFYALDVSGRPVIGGGSNYDSLPMSEQFILPGEPWDNLSRVSIKTNPLPILSVHTNDQFSLTTDVYDYLDDVMLDYPDYVTKHLAGDDGQGNDIYYYSARPADYVVLGQGDLPQGEPGGSYYQAQIERPKIIIVTGVHGNETHNITAAIAFFEDLCRNWKTKNKYNLLRWGIELIYVPVMCPTGFNARTRTNWNGVNLARNFPAGWEDLTTSQKGASPASEMETQALISVLEEHSDAICVIDSHRKFRLDNGYESLIWLAAEGDDIGLALNFINDHVSYMKRRYDYLEQGNEPVGSLGSHINGSVSKYAFYDLNIPSFLLETPNSIGANGLRLLDLQESAENATLNLVFDVFERYRRTPHGLAS